VLLEPRERPVPQPTADARTATAASQRITHDAGQPNLNPRSKLRVLPLSKLPSSLQWDFENKLDPADDSRQRRRATSHTMGPWAPSRTVTMHPPSQPCFVHSGQQTSDYTPAPHAATQRHVLLRPATSTNRSGAGTAGCVTHHIAANEYSVIAMTKRRAARSPNLTPTFGIRTPTIHRMPRTTLTTSA